MLGREERMSYLDQVERALAEFCAARSAIMETFAASVAPEIVSKVIDGEMAREGKCRNGLAYRVHGIGYTVTSASGGEIHFDGSDYGDFFTEYDVSFFMETSSSLRSMETSSVRAALELLCERGDIREVGVGKFSLVGSE
ncbi:DUF6896 domain-containing protein [Crossiella sp. NPDC003009]